MNNRGLSSVVTVLLVIFVSVAAVSGIWFIIKPLVSDPIQASPVVCQSTTFEVKSCQKIITSAGQNGYNIAYTLKDKNDQVESLSDIKIIIDLEDGSRLAGSGDAAIQVGETKDVQLITNSLVSGASVLSILNLDSDRKTSCNSQEFTCESTPVITELDPQWQIPVPIENMSIFGNMTNQTDGNGTTGNNEGACFGQYKFSGAGDYQGLCSYGVYQEELCERHDRWEGNCHWFDQGHCTQAPNSFNPSCIGMNQEECDNNNGMENGCRWENGAGCAGPRLFCTDMHQQDSCNDLEGCNWEENPVCGDGVLNYNEECDASAQKFFWYDSLNGGENTYIGDLIPVTCSNNRNAFFKKYEPNNPLTPTELVNCNSECKLVETTCNLCGNGIAEGEVGEECDGNYMDLGGWSNEQRWNSNDILIGECTSYNRNISPPANYQYECPNPSNPECYTSMNEPTCTNTCQMSFATCS